MLVVGGVEIGAQLVCSFPEFVIEVVEKLLPRIARLSLMFFTSYGQSRE